MNELIKAQYRNNDLKDNAYETAKRIFDLVPASSFLKSPDILKAFCHAVAITIISDSVKTMKKNIDTMVGKKIDIKEAENIIKEMSGLFLDEMEAAARVAMIDLELWANKASSMGAGAERMTETVSAAWAGGTPALFSDFRQRVKWAIDGYVNSTFQMLVISNAD